MALAYNAGGKTTDMLSRNFEILGNDSNSPDLVSSYTDNWNDHCSYLREYGYMFEDHKELQSLVDIAQRNSGKIEEKKRHHLPFTVGVLLRKSLNKHWGIEIGLNYTRLVSDFETGNNAFISERQKLHYIGIPLRGNYLLGEFKRFSIYSSVGVALEIPVSMTLKTEYVIDGRVDYSKRHTLDAPLQWSVNGALVFNIN